MYVSASEFHVTESALIHGTINGISEVRNPSYEGRRRYLVISLN